MVKSLSIIIVTYKSQSLINSCLNSILNNIDIEPDQIEVIIVDNSPKYDAIQIENLVEKHPLKELIVLKYIHNTKNLGYGQGNNVGIENSTGKIICIMNPDVNLVSPVFKRVISHFIANLNLALLGGKQLGHNDLSFYFMPERNVSVFESLLVIAFNKLNLFNKNCMFLSGALLFIDKNKFKKIGCFDENIFMYKEEADITTRIIEKNYNIIFDPKIRYRHLIDEREKWNKVSAERAFESLQYYCGKYNYSVKKIIKKNIVSLKFNSLLYKAFGLKEQLIGNQNKLGYYRDKLEYLIKQ